MEQLGKGFKGKRNRHRVSDIENGEGRMTITMILEVIDALERATGESIVPGAVDPSEGLRLATFFLGPSDSRALASAARVFGAREEAGARE